MKLVRAIWALLYAAMLVWVNVETKAPANLRINVELFYGTGYMEYYTDYETEAMIVINRAQTFLSTFSARGTNIQLNVLSPIEQRTSFDDTGLTGQTTDMLKGRRQVQTNMFIYFAYDDKLTEAVIRKSGLRSSMCGNDESLRTLVLNEASQMTLARRLAYYIGMLLGMRPDHTTSSLTCHPNGNNFGIMYRNYWGKSNHQKWNKCNVDDFKQYVTASTTTLANGKRSRFCCESIPQSLTVRLWASYDSRYKASIPVGEDAKTNIEETVAEAQKLLNKDGKLGRTFNLAMTTNDIIEMANDFNYDANVQDNMKGPFNAVLQRTSRQVGAGGEFDVYFTYLDAMPIAHASIGSAICHNDKSRRTIILTRENFGNFGAARQLAFFIARAFGIGYDDYRRDMSGNNCDEGLMDYMDSSHTLSDGKLQKFGPPSQIMIYHYQDQKLTWNQCNVEDLEFAFTSRQGVADCFL